MATISTPYYQALDFILIFFACAIAYLVRFDTLFLPASYVIPTTIFALIASVSLGITKFYQTTNSKFSLQQIFAAVSGLITAAMLTMACLYLTKTGDNFSRIWFVVSIVISFLLLVSIRVLISQLFELSSPARTVVLLGSEESSINIRAKVEKNSGEKISIVNQFEPPSSKFIKQKTAYLSKV